MLTWSLMILSVLTAARPTVEVETLQGEVVTGSIVRLDADEVTLKIAKGQVSLGIEGLLALSPKNVQSGSTPKSAVWVKLLDGSSLVGLDYSAQAGEARIAVPSGKIVELATRDIVAVRFQAEDGSVAEEWSRILEAPTDSDLLVVRKADSIDYHQGLLQDVTEEVVQFELDGEVLPVKRSKVYGLRYYRAAGRTLPEPVGWLTDVGGSTWAVRSIALEGEELQWTTPLGLEVSAALGSVVRIDFSRGKILYLSDLEPESVQWTPYFGSRENLPAAAQFFAPREDRGLEPGPLELDGKQYAKGLALHSRTRLVYRLPGQFSRFKAIAGIDDRVRPRGHIRLVIRGDDRVLLETDVAGTDPPKPIDVELGGVRRLTILVDFGEDLDVADHLDLCEARIVK